MLAILEPGKEDELRRVLLVPKPSALNRFRPAARLPCASCAARRPLFSWRGSPPPPASISIVSALTPEMADRVDLVTRRAAAGRPRRRPHARARARARRWSGSRAGSPGASAAPGGSRSRSSFASAVAHLAKGLDFEEARSRTSSCSSRSCARAAHFVAPGRPGDDPAARAGRRCARRLRRRSLFVYAYDHDASLGAHRGGAADRDRRARRSARSGSGCGRCRVEPPESSDRERGRRARAGARQPTASRTSRSAATRATSSRRAAARSSRTA